MHWKKKSLNDYKLYLILDTEVNDYDHLLKVAQQSVSWGVDMIQLRDKKGRPQDILRFSRSLLGALQDRVPFIMNDRVDLAVAAGASGVHLGQDDVPIAHARKMMGPKAIIGCSCQSREQAEIAQDQGTDYIGFGSVFKTKTKPDREPLDLNLLLEVITHLKIPVFAIGGINPENIDKLYQRGINRVAVCRAICEAADPKEAIQQLRKA